MDEQNRFKKRPYEMFEDEMRAEAASGKPVDVNSPLYKFLTAQSDENARKVEQIKRDIEVAADNPDLIKALGEQKGREIEERLRMEREGDLLEQERFKNLRKMILEKKYPGYKE